MVLIAGALVTAAWFMPVQFGTLTWLASMLALSVPAMFGIAYLVQHVGWVQRIALPFHDELMLAARSFRKEIRDDGRNVGPLSLPHAVKQGLFAIAFSVATGAFFMAIAIVICSVGDADGLNRCASETGTSERSRAYSLALVPAEGAVPLVPWLGGKARLATRIIARLEAIHHRCYAEPFVGMGGVFLRRKMRPKSEIINDRNGEIVNLFRVVREHPAEFSRQFEWSIPSRQEFERFLAMTPDALTDIQRAARFTAMAFGGLPANRATKGQLRAAFVSGPQPFTAAAMQKRISAAHRRLAGVHIECIDWSDFIPRYDCESTLFYVDPPYYGKEDNYGKGLFARG